MRLASSGLRIENNVEEWLKMTELNDLLMLALSEPILKTECCFDFGLEGDDFKVGVELE